MKHKNLFKTIALKTYDAENFLSVFAKFLIDNRETIRINDMDANAIYRTNVLSNTPNRAIFDNALKNGKINKLLSPIKIPSNVPMEIPELVTTDLFVFDVLQVEEIDSSVYRSICTLPEYSDKIVLNFTNFIQRKSNVPNDISSIHSESVRAMLFRSHYISESLWLSPELISYLAKSYSMIISSLIARTYNLDYNQQLVIATVLTIYFYQQCLPEEEPKELPTMAISNSSYLGNRLDLVDRFEQIKTTLEEMGTLKLNLPKVCTLLSKLLGSRLEGFDVRSLYTICRGLNSQRALSNALSIEYPPQWAHFILDALSGSKTNMSIRLKSIPDLKKDSLGFAEKLNKDRSFIPKL